VSFLKRLFKFYINSSVHVAFSVLALAHLTPLRFGYSLPRPFFFALFFAAVFGYNFVKFFGLAKFHYRSLTTKLKEIQILSAFCFIGFVICFFGLKAQVQSSLIFLGLITFFYAMPLKWNSSKSLRKISGLKIYIIAFVWAATTAFLPQLQIGLELTRIDYWWVLERFVFIFILMLPFEIRDMNFDDLKLSTIPQRLGLKNTKKIGYLGVLLLFVSLIFAHNFNVVEFNSSLLTLLLLVFFLFKSSTKKTQYFTAFWVEALPIFWWVLWIGFELLNKPSTF